MCKLKPKVERLYLAAINHLFARAVDPEQFEREPVPAAISPSIN